jgi:hypothetical protein
LTPASPGSAISTSVLWAVVGLDPSKLSVIKLQMSKMDKSSMAFGAIQCTNTHYGTSIGQTRVVHPLFLLLG